MTISLEEYVAGAIARAYTGPMYEDGATALAMARAAISAVREYEGAAEEVSMSMFVSSAEKRRYEMGMKDKASRIRESERAACEAIAREMSKKYLQLAEPMKRPTTRSYFEKAANALDHAADTIAARHGKGEGK